MKQRMKATGIVVEYNPFHNGHLHHLNEAKRITNCDVLIAVMSPNFVQRGEPSFIDKWKRTQIALEMGIDIVIELPTYFTLQSATVFAQTSIEILNKMGIQSIVFGSESNNLESLKSTAFQLTKFKTGHSYPASFSNTIHPNDILGIEYLKALRNTSITPYTIKRTNAYHSSTIDSTIASATSIRKAHFDKTSYEHTTPMNLGNSVTHTLSDYDSLIHYKITSTSSSSLKSIILVDEGIENLFKKHAYHPLSQLVERCISKRYTRSRIQRTLCQILLNNPKEYPEFTNFRILGITQQGQKYLAQYKKEHDNIPYTTKFKEYCYKDEEYKATSIYALPKGLDYQRELLKLEVNGPILMKKD